VDFIDSLRHFSSRVEKLRGQIQTEEATKTSLIMPFFQQVFGYDVFNPDEFVPEFTADVGIKKGEKVDYCIFMEGNPVILIEAKWCGVPLEKHDSQLFRYFGTTTAKFGILTNGVVYKFYTDLEEQNKMDLKPFLELNLLDIRETLVPKLKMFCKSKFNVDEVFNSAAELKYSNEVRGYFDRQLKEPSDDYVKFILANVYEGMRTQAVIEKFKPIIKNTLNNYINELMNEKITTALKAERMSEAEADLVSVTEDKIETQILDKIVTTQEELEAFGIVKGMICDIVSPSKVSYKDTESYFSIIYGGKVTKWVCRLIMNGKKKYLVIPAGTDASQTKDTKVQIETSDDLHIHRESIRASAIRFVK
jgi:hypothetical protein